MASTDRYGAVRAVAGQVTMEVRWDGPRRRQRSYLTEILDLAAGMGRALPRSARSVRRTCDCSDAGGLMAPLAGPGTDKMGRETIVPIGPEVRSALLEFWRAGASRAAPCSDVQRAQIDQSPRPWPGNGCAGQRARRNSRRRRAVLSMPIAEAGQRLGSIYLCRTLPLLAAGRGRWRSSGPTSTQTSIRC